MFLYSGLRPIALVAAAVSTAWACNDCYGPTNLVTHVRHVPRMQPGAAGAAYGPTRELDWGQINFLHTTDTHGWLEGHIKEQNYGADWGDFVSFTKHMKNRAAALNVDLLLVDTGDLHDGAGLSDATSPNGLYSNPIFENVDYDLLTIGNHELYVSDIAYETFYNFSKVYGDKYLTSNVQIYNPTTKNYTYIGSKYRYFSTPKGLRIMAFGVLYDFTGNSNASLITKGADMVKQQWFLDAIKYSKPIDLFVLIGHNPIRGSGSTLTTVYQAIRAANPSTPIAVFGGHTHIRDFAVYDTAAAGLESGRYCETLGWMSLSGINSSSYFGAANPVGLPTPSRIATVTPSTSTASSKTSSATSSASASALSSPYRWSRRYLDWNRLSFAAHANESQSQPFDLDAGVTVSQEIYTTRNQLNLTNGSVYGCAPATYCQFCKPYGDPGNINTLLATALAATVINQTRKDIPRLIIINSGSIRFDLVQGPFTYDDSFIVSPFSDAFQFIPNVPYTIASQILGILNAGAFQKRSESEPDHPHQEVSYTPFTGADSCLDPTLGRLSASDLRKRSTRGIIRRQSTALVPGYTTSDDFGTDGDDIAHSKIPNYAQPNDIQANASFPLDGSMPPVVDLIFLDFIGTGYVIPALTQAGGKYTAADIQYYLPPTFTTNSYLPAYAKLAWQKNVNNCPVGKGVGY